MPSIIFISVFITCFRLSLKDHFPCVWRRRFRGLPSWRYCSHYCWWYCLLLEVLSIAFSGHCRFCSWWQCCCWGQVEQEAWRWHCSWRRMEHSCSYYERSCCLWLSTPYSATSSFPPLLFRPVSVQQPLPSCACADYGCSNILEN